MIPLVPTDESKEHVWAKLSRCNCEFAIYLATYKLHAIEACVSITKRESLDEFKYFVLKATDLLGNTDIEGINSLLHLGRQVLQQIVVNLGKDELLSISREGLLEVTCLGKKVLEEGVMIKLEKKRHLFHFINGSNEFVNIRDHNNFLADLKPYETSPEWKFDVEILTKCIEGDDDWKKQRQFPEEIHELITPTEESTLPEGVSKESTLIIDKGQFVDLAILVKFKDNEPVELTAYPISAKGHLKGTEHLFSLRGKEDVLRILPDVNGTPDDDKTLQACLLLGRKHILSNIDDMKVTCEKTHAIIEISNDDDIFWTRFYWQNIQQKTFCDIRCETTTRMVKLIIKSKGHKQQAISHLYEIVKSYAFEDILADMPAYRVWLSEMNQLADEPVQKLASLAWDIGNYRLAYSLAELEDMMDAEI